MPFWKRAVPSGETSFDATFRYETSWILPPAVLCLARALLSLYAFTTIFTIFGYNGTHKLSEASEHSFSYFTNLTYWGLAFYFLVSAMHTCTYCLTRTPLLARWTRPLQIAHGIFYSTIVVYPWIVTIVYWALLYSGTFNSAFSAWTNTSQHALNSVYAVFEIIFPRTAPLPFLHLLPIIVILALYLALAYITYATEGFFVYSFLDTKRNSSGKVAGYIIGILVAAIVVFLIVRYLIMLRVWITEEKLGKSGKFVHRERTYTDGDAEKGVSPGVVTAK
ncbi:hypothetical protein K491DRAFT_689514 [Lophiostoma macrostomum CBS 122681]|uniref:FAR-17a/AIG1-like protein n=1 Tax=Lophiostoma macrostomum CBS 122681 TaxID=1314788 RepID=A0A6A6TGW6_9PLEO|nr:hypothetical protein K491DRAFT_689514 [Lophiostoma macrostomum CBS 122681]